jgi:hypothetical protein
MVIVFSECGKPTLKHNKTTEPIIPMHVGVGFVVKLRGNQQLARQQDVITSATSSLGCYIILFS